MIISILYFILFFGIFLSMLVFQKVNRQPTSLIKIDQPKVSILIAARNEEQNIIRCLQSIEQLNYTSEKIEILIGDDASGDNTLAIIQEYIKDKPKYRCIPIIQKLGQAQGKANVLAHLTKLATSDFYFITDADVAAPPNWIQNMLAGVSPETGIVTGITSIAGENLFYRLQAIDWFNALGLIQIVADFKLPVSTMGNNMLISRQAYEATGGYENMPFSVTEDVQLFNAVIKRGFGFRNIFDAGVLAWSMPVKTWPALLHQRKRWMKGIWHLPWYMKVILIVYASFYAFCLPFAFYTSVQVVLAIFLGKLFLQTFFIYRSLKRLQLTYPVWQLLLFEFYAIFVSVSALLFFLMPVKLTWKDRKY